MSFYGKENVYPACKEREAEFIGCELFGEDGEKLCPVYAMHFRPQGDALVCGEGAEEAEAVLPEGVTSLYENGRGALYAFTDKGFYACGTGEPVLLGINTGRPVAVISCPDKDSAYSDYAVTNADVLRLNKSGFVPTGGQGGSCAAYHYERLFTAKEMRVRFSKPLEAWNWTNEAQGAGYIDLPPAGGNVISILSFKDKLYLFRERGITQLRALGDNLNFKLTVMPVQCGKILAGSPADCGSHILFLAEDGLYSFNGGTCKRWENSGFDLIDGAQEITASARGGRYFASVALKSGGRCLFCADAETEKSWFLRGEALFPAGGDGTLFAFEGKTYRIRERGFFPDTENCCTLETAPLSLGTAARKYVDAITLTGAGDFRVQVRSDEKKSETVCGRAGEKINFPTPVAGRSFLFRILTVSPRAALRGAIVRFREEE